MKLVRRAPVGSTLIARRPSVKSICTAWAPFWETAADLTDVLHQQIFDEPFARVAGTPIRPDTADSARTAR